MLAERGVGSVLLAAGTLPLSGGSHLAVPVLALGLSAGAIAALAYRWVGPGRGRALAWASLLLDVALASILVAATGGGESPAFSLYLAAFLTPLALREPVATLAAGPAAAIGYLLATVLHGPPVDAGSVMLRLAILASVALAAVRMQVERRALVREHDRRVQELSAINSMAHELTAILDPEVLLGRVLVLVRERLGHAEARIALVTGDRLLVRRAGDPTIESRPLAEASLLADAVRTGRPVLGPGGPAGPAAAAIPLVAAGRVRGAIEVTKRQGGARREAGAIGARDVRSLEALAAFTAVALENAELHQSALRSALTDPLTGLFNVRYLQETLGAALERAQAAGRPFSLLMLDVDNLRQINNESGHMVGDVALREVGRIIASATRAGDIAARYGGDEFLLALPDAGPESAATVAERIRHEVEAIDLEHHGARVPLTVSIGVASHPRDGATLDALVEAADRAAYRAKARGRNRIALLSPLDADRALPEPEAS
ncbi:MAG TPA: GGDEF domain-containing protein [Thermodesulfobacteriota bacterium]